MKALILLLFFLPTWAYARVPDPPEICAAVAMDARLPAEHDRWTTRVRAAGWMPELDVSIHRRLGWNQDSRFKEQLGRVDDRLEFKTAQTDSLDGEDDQWTFEVSLRFDLQRVIFSRDEFAADETARKNLILRHDLCDRALQLYFSWRESSRLARVGFHDDRVLHAEARDLAQARIDALTGGWFSTVLKQEAP